ncbi:hypothetical protein ILYODFUR_002843 [Ilyodon furcidens]|uniref:Uncharacterized protein n=1 Tax=Ilyodon furcidens TaxID=33524 RepID=A0ABV0SL88_9TELE
MKEKKSKIMETGGTEVLPAKVTCFQAGKSLKAAELKQEKSRLGKKTLPEVCWQGSMCTLTRSTSLRPPIYIYPHFMSNCDAEKISYMSHVAGNERGREGKGIRLKSV